VRQFGGDKTNTQDIIDMLKNNAVVCPVCKNPDWGIEPGQHVIKAIIENEVQSHTGIHVNIAMCKKCQHMLLFNVT